MIGEEFAKMGLVKNKYKESQQPRQLRRHQIIHLEGGRTLRFVGHGAPLVARASERWGTYQRPPWKERGGRLFFPEFTAVTGSCGLCRGRLKCRPDGYPLELRCRKFRPGSSHDRSSLGGNQVVESGRHLRRRIRRGDATGTKIA